jgi:hypothetical protein
MSDQNAKMNLSLSPRGFCLSVVMEHEDSEAAAAAALLLIVEQSYKDLEKAGNDVQRVKARSDSLVERTSAQRSRDAMSSANAQEGVKVRKAGSRQKLSKTSQGN